MPVARVVLAVTAGPPRPLLVVLRALGLGDFLTGLPALRALSDAYPDHRRVLVMPAALEPLARLAAVVDEVLPSPGLEPITGRLPPPDVAVNLHGRGPQSHRILLTLRPRRLVAFAHPSVPESAGGPAWRAHEHEVSRWCRLLAERGIAADPTRLELAVPPIAPPEGTAGATVVHPGAASGARRWPLERWAAVARHETESGRNVVLTGGPAETSSAEAVAALAGLPSSSVLAGRTDVVQLAAVVGAAGLVVCGDTGVAHLATALGTPSVVLFGPTPPAEWGPPAERRRHRALWAGGTGDPHGAQPDRGLLSITVDDVLAEVQDLRRELGSAVGPSRVVDG